MIVEYRTSFLRDIKKHKSKAVANLILAVIENCKKAHRIEEINHCEALKSRGKFFKIKQGHYRFGIHIDNGTIEFLKIRNPTEFL